VFQGHHVDTPWPWDFALLPVRDEAWTGLVIPPWRRVMPGLLARFASALTAVHEITCISSPHHYSPI
jgi:hypothetical protein